MRSLREHWRLWSAIVVGWTLFGLSYTYHYYHFAPHYIEIFRRAPTLRQMIVWEMPYWLLWAVLSPPVFVLARRFRFERGRVLRSLPVHVAACVAFALVHRAAYLLIGWALHVSVYRQLADLSKVYGHDFLFNLPNGFMCYALALLVGYAVTYYNRYQDEEVKTSRLETEVAQTQLQMEQAQLQALRMQLHPHFLSNALQCISGLLREDVEAAEEMLARLGHFLRLTLEHSDESEVTLRKELEYVGCYLEIQQARFRDRLKVERDIEPETLAALVPSLILQPIVENAIKHGIASRVRGGSVRIRAGRRGGRLRLEVEDDGPGIRGDADARAGDEQGLGLRNTRARLGHLYGDSQRLRLSGAPGGGLRVTLEIPCVIQIDAPDAPAVGREGQVAAT